MRLIAKRRALGKEEVYTQSPAGAQAHKLSFVGMPLTGSNSLAA